MPASERKQSGSIIFSEECSVGGLMTDWGLSFHHLLYPTCGIQKVRMSRRLSVGITESVAEKGKK
ncbi:MAG: hypothetical protein SPI30_02990 [Prevotella sp.]|nr:hypothetical protein [Prevotella sp.]